MSKSIPGPGCFWIESSQPTGYRESLVSVSESGSEKSPSRQFITKVKYKIDHNSKTKYRTKKLRNSKLRFRTLRIFWDDKIAYLSFVSEHCASFLAKMKIALFERGGG